MHLTTPGVGGAGPEGEDAFARCESRGKAQEQSRGRLGLELESRPMVVTAITVSLSGYLLWGQLRFLKNTGFRVILLSSPGPEVNEIADSEGIEHVAIHMEREIRPLRDVVSLWELWRVLHTLRPDIVNSGTPKAGFLVTLAAWFARVPCRIYTIRGFRHECCSGLLRHVLRTTEWLTCRLAHKVVCISPSLRRLAVEEGIVDPGKAVVLGNGSSNGIDIKRFSKANPSLVKEGAMKARLGISLNALVIGFVGRLTPDKGIGELAEAWLELRKSFPEALLLLVGPEEKVDLWGEGTRARLRSDSRVLMTGYVKDVENYFQLMDVFVLPTHREGFGNVLIQAAAMGVPVVTTNVTGASDAVRHGFNGKVVPARNPLALADAIGSYLLDPLLRRDHGRNGPVWAARFEEGIVWQNLELLYRDGFNARRGPHRTVSTATS